MKHMLTGKLYFFCFVSIPSYTRADLTWKASSNEETQRIKIYKTTFPIDRSTRPEVFCKKAVLRIFAKFKGKHLCQRLSFNKVADLRHATFLKRVSGTGVFL